MDGFPGRRDARSVPALETGAGPVAMVETVLGPVPAVDLGRTLIHEHLVIDLWPWFDPPDPADPAAVALAGAPVSPEIMAAVRANPFAVRDNLVLDDLDLATVELAWFAAAGGRTVVDLTLPEIGRDPASLRELSRRTGLHVVMGCGRYIGRARPAELDDAPVEALRDEIVRDLLEGVDVGDGSGASRTEGGTGASRTGYGTSYGGTGGGGPVRAGIIGEIGTSDPLEPREERALVAAAAAQRETGRGLVVHLDPWGANGHAVLDRALEAGADPGRVVLAHLDPALPDLDRLRSLAARGVFVSLDIWGDEDAYGGRGMPADDQRLAAVIAAFDEGWADRLVLAQDVCLKGQLRAHGGRGYDHLLATIAPRLRAAGLDEAGIDALLILNPRRVLAGPAT